MSSPNFEYYNDGTTAIIDDDVHNLSRDAKWGIDFDIADENLPY